MLNKIKKIREYTHTFTIGRIVNSRRQIVFVTPIMRIDRFIGKSGWWQFINVSCDIFNGFPDTSIVISKSSGRKNLNHKS